MFFRILLIFGAIITGISSVDTNAFAAPRSYVPQIRQAFSFYLKDPSSVQIEILNNKPDAICGRYNAKNSFGGYVGYKFFSYEPSTGSLYLVGTIIDRSGQIQDSLAMIENLPTDPSEFKSRIAEARAVGDRANGKLQDCVNA
jgi:hypothetical protein